ncbi:MAG: hypothetical protein GY715_07260, partial [Planctomycetes bacterium]|nr:hypothetical protein [Planctomycetota bacterium]
DPRGRAHVARYAARGPVALGRMTYDADGGMVQIVSDKADGPTAGTRTFEALEFLALLLAHVPRKGEVYVRYCGAYSVRRRAAWREAGVLAARGAAPVRDAEDAGGDGDGLELREAVPAGVRSRRRRWAELLRKVWDVDVESCPRCGGPMTILAFTLDPATIDATLRGLRRKGADARTGPWAARAPPADPAATAA